MTVPALTKEQAPAVVQAAAAERDTIQANLLELDGSFGKRLLTEPSSPARPSALGHRGRPG